MHEHTFNVLLADALNRQNAEWGEHESAHAERQTGKKRADIIVDEPGLTMKPVIIECEFGGHPDHDAKKRLTESEFEKYDTAVALAIPDAFKNMTDGEARAALLSPDCALRYAAFQRRAERFPSDGFCEGNAADLAAFVRLSSTARPAIEEAAGLAAERIAAASAILDSRLTADGKDRVRQAMGLRPGAAGDASLDGLRIAALLWLDAMLVQSHLKAHGFEAVRSERNPGPQILAVDFLRAAWERILEENWKAIFRPAIDALTEADDDTPAAVSDALRDIAAVRKLIERARIGDSFNVGGELFPKITADRKTAAAFYTTPSTAEFLSRLTIRRDDGHDWHDPQLLRRIRIADLACGTGTLLRASWRRVRSFGEASFGAQPGLNRDQVSEAHTAAMEGGLIGADVSPIAAHLANSGMALAGKGRPYGQTQIGWVAVGHGRGAAGSLEFLASDTVPEMLGAEPRVDAAASGSDEDDSGISVGDGSLHYVLMNPPYSRTRGGQSAFDIAGMTDTERHACQERWKSLVRSQPASLTAGMAASFLCLAQKKAAPGGRIGFVLPLTAAFEKSWEKTRTMIRNNFNSIIAVTTAGQSKAQAYSADTGMSEMLLVADKNPESRLLAPPAAINCVTLKRSPLRPGEAGEFARSVLDGMAALPVSGDADRAVFAGNEELGQIIRFSPEGPGDPWSPLGSLQDSLSLEAVQMARDGRFAGQEFRCPMTVVGELFEVGPTHHLIGYPRGNEPIGAYEWIPLAEGGGAGKARALWAADAKSQSQLLCAATHRGTQRDGGTAAALKIEGSQGRLHYSRGMRWTSQSVIAAVTGRDVFGGRAWTTLLHDDSRVRSAFVLWANSIFGFLAHWSRASRTQAGRAPMQVKAIADIPCPDFFKLDDDSLNLAAERFAALCDRVLWPACQCHCDPARHEIDLAAAEVIGFDAKAGDDAFRDLRERWCLEESVNGGNRDALRALREADLLAG